MQFIDFIPSNFLPYEKSIRLKLRQKTSFNTFKYKKYYFKRNTIFLETQLLYYLDFLGINSEKKELKIDIKKNFRSFYLLINSAIDISYWEFNNLFPTEFSRLFDIIYEDYIIETQKFFENEEVKKFLGEEKETEETDKKKKKEIYNPINPQYFKLWNLFFKLIYNLNVPESLYQILDFKFVIWLIRRIEKEEILENMQTLKIFNSVAKDSIMPFLTTKKSKKYDSKVNEIYKEYIKGLGYGKLKSTTVLEFITSDEKIDTEGILDGNPMNDPWFQIKVEGK